MSILVRLGLLLALVAVAPGTGLGRLVEREVRDELVLVPKGGGVFVDPVLFSRLGHPVVLRGGGTRVRALPEPGPESMVVLYRPVRPLIPGVVYDVFLDVGGRLVQAPYRRVGCCFSWRYRAVAGAAPDREPPRWRGPVVVETSYRHSRFGPYAEIEFELPVEDSSPIRVRIEARPLGGGGDGDELVAMVQPDGRFARVEWDTEWPADHSLRPEGAYLARVCAEDAAGNRSCAPEEASFTAPT
jgi:hypothetical protein